MEIRKIQKTGGSSYIVSLPKDWIVKMKLDAKDKVGIIVRRDGNLLIVPKIVDEKSSKEIIIEVDQVREKSLLFRMLVASYHRGYNIIKLVSKTRLNPSIKETVRNFVKNAIGLEIMEENSNQLTIKDLLNPDDLNFKAWLERISNLVLNQLKDTLYAIESGEKEVLEEIIKKDVEVNRVNWLIARKHNIVADDIFLIESLNQAGASLADYSLISRIIERVGDHVVRIAEYFQTIEGGLDRELKESILDAGQLAINLFENSINAFFQKDLVKSNQNIENLPKLLEKCDEIERKAATQESRSILALGYVVESIRRTGEYSSDLAEYTINFLIDDLEKQDWRCPANAI